MGRARHHAQIQKDCGRWLLLRWTSQRQPCFVGLIETNRDREKSKTWRWRWLEVRVFSVPPNGTWLSCGEGRRDREVDGREDERPFCSHELVRGGLWRCRLCSYAWLLGSFRQSRVESKDNDRVHPWPVDSRFAAKVTLTTPWRHP